jgi:TDG/mug DNA glycosylase family protein
MREAQEFATLPDYLEPGLDLVFVGINPGLYSVAQGHYFARKTSRFWPAFSASKLSRNIRSGLRLDILTPQQDALLLRFGIGFTDVVKRPSANVGELTTADFERWIPVFLNKLQHYKPRVACFHGIMGFRPFLKMGLKCQSREPSLGPSRRESEIYGSLWCPIPAPPMLTSGLRIRLPGMTVLMLFLLKIDQCVEQ